VIYRKCEKYWLLDVYFGILKMNLTSSSVYYVKRSYYIKFDK